MYDTLHFTVKFSWLPTSLREMRHRLSGGMKVKAVDIGIASVSYFFWLIRKIEKPHRQSLRLVDGMWRGFLGNYDSASQREGGGAAKSGVTGVER